jgi:hypothetical protein
MLFNELFIDEGSPIGDDKGVTYFRVTSTYLLIEKQGLKRPNLVLGS